MKKLCSVLFAALCCALLVLPVRADPIAAPAAESGTSILSVVILIMVGSAVVACGLILYFALRKK